MAPVLAYWKLRGICQPIRYLLIHAGVDFEEKSYLVTEDAGEKGVWSEWFDVKYTLGLDFPNLPYYKDGSFHLTQTGAILRYLAEEHDFEPTTPEEKRRVRLSEYQIVDCRRGLIDVVFNRDDRYEKLKQAHEEATLLHLQQFSEFLGKNTWIAGDKITYVDFMFYEYLAHHNVFIFGCVDKHSNLKEYMNRFEALPNIAKYMKTDDFRCLMMYGPTAKFEDPVKDPHYWTA